MQVLEDKNIEFKAKKKKKRERDRENLINKSHIIASLVFLHSKER